RILVPDLRGHGATTLAADAAWREDWSDLVADILVLLGVLGVADAVMAGHSMGGTVALLAAAEAPTLARRLLLVDPVVLPPGERISPRSVGSVHSPLYVGALKRRREFADRAAALSAYRERGAFAGWREEMLADYIDAGFRTSGDRVRLACAPEWEASNYLAHGHDPWAALTRYPGPIDILRAAEGSACAIDEAAAASLAPGRIRVRTFPDATHFLPMCDPETVRGALAAALA
ncbi:MAG: alpha/beta hydrolase, partial [Caulobacteraceae bacterium]